MARCHHSARREFFEDGRRGFGRALRDDVRRAGQCLRGPGERPDRDRGIGIGNMGRGDLGAFLGRSDVQYVAVCDVRSGFRDAGKKMVDDHSQNQDCASYNDFRELLARPDIDAVHIATPDHWHAIMVIEACRNGKDVYCQNPEARTLREGPLMIEAARRYSRVVSGGSQRVLEDYRGVVQCWGGELGPIKSINVNVGPLSQLCNLPAESVPSDMDWDLWLGPAPWAVYNPGRCDGNFGTIGGVSIIAPCLNCEASGIDIA